MFREIKLQIWQIIIKDEVCGVDSDIGSGVKKHDLKNCVKQVIYPVKVLLID